MKAKPVQAFLARMTLENRRKKLTKKLKITNFETPQSLRSRRSEYAQSVRWSKLSYVRMPNGSSSLIHFINEILSIRDRSREDRLPNLTAFRG